MSDTEIQAAVAPAPFAPPAPVGPERRAAVITETDRHAIASIVVELMHQHRCRFKDVSEQELKDSIKIVLASRRVAFWAGALFVGSLITAFAGGVVWFVVEGFKALIKHASG